MRALAKMIDDLDLQSCSPLTSRDSRQNQQNTCLHLLHIICAQPASLSISTRHIGHGLMSAPSGPPPFSANRKSEPTGEMASSRPPPPITVFLWTRLWPYWAQVLSGCQLPLHREQNSLEQLWHFTALGASAEADSSQT